MPKIQHSIVGQPCAGMKINKIKCNKRLTIGTRCMQIEPFTRTGAARIYSTCILHYYHYFFRFELLTDGTSKRVISG